ncbi:MAG: hypothetical protein C5B57_13720, partial [Blastocatellia bacterium]
MEHLRDRATLQHANGRRDPNGSHASRPSARAPSSHTHRLTAGGTVVAATHTDSNEHFVRPATSPSDAARDSARREPPAMTDAGWTVGVEHAGMALAKFLARADCLGSHTRAREAVERGKVFLNGTEVDARQASTRLAIGDIVRVWIDRPGTAKRRTTVRSAGPLRIVYEDDVLLVVDKPAGLLTVPLERKRDAASVYDLLEKQWRSRKRRPFVVHRIDRDTSGVVIFAKDVETQQRLRNQFKRQAPERIYLAVV